MVKKVYEKQPDWKPTNKATTASAVAALLTVNIEPVTSELWPMLVPAAFAGPAVTNLVTALVGMFFGLAMAWFIPDKAGIPNE